MGRLLGYIGKHEDYLALSMEKAAYDRITAVLLTRLDPAIFQANVEAGRKLSIEQVQAEARLMAREVSEYGKS
jgi:hypothetical protein